MTPEALQKRTKLFAVDVIRLYRSLPNDEVARIIGKQIVRSGTSVGANYRSACLAKSTADMVNKLKIVEEESDETAFWLELLREADVMVSPQADRLLQEANELRKITSASIKTLKSRSQVIHS